MSDKLPALQFYVGDWRKDPGVQALSFHDRGVWFEILCLMHESSDRGKLLLNGKPMPDDALARLLGLDKQVLTNALTNLVTYGVADREAGTGALVCRRMVRDEEVRRKRRECGKMGGNPRLLNQTHNQNPTTEVKQKTTPSSSSSISTSIDEENIKRPSGVPANEKQAVEWASMENVPAEFAVRIFHELEGVNWRDGAQRSVTNWRSYIRGRYSKRQQVKAPERNQRKENLVAKTIDL